MALKKRRSKTAPGSAAAKKSTLPAPTFSHLDERGALRMVDVSAKSATQRTAVAEGRVVLGAVIARALAGQGTRAGALKKGNVFEAARLAGILAAKRVDTLIPLCHGLPIEHLRIDFTLTATAVRIEAEARTSARTGVEMEALTAVAVAALTIYDMCKALGKGMTIDAIRLLSKTGGKSGDYFAPVHRGGTPRTRKSPR